MTAVLRTGRLVLRELRADDADFVLALVNDPDWLAQIGDRGLRTVDDARAWLADGPWTRYRSQGFGFWAVERCGEPGPVGVCGLAQRGHLDAPDLGFAFLPAGRGQGLASEAATAVVQFAIRLGLPRLLATTREGNARSRRLLESLGLRVESTLVSPSSGQPLLLYACRLPSDGASPA